MLGLSLQCLPDTPRTGNRGRESDKAWHVAASHSCVRLSTAEFSVADTPHPFAGAAVCYGLERQGMAWRGKANTPRIFGCAEVCRTMRGLAQWGMAWRGRAMQTHSGQRWPLQSAQSGEAGSSRAGRGKARQTHSASSGALQSAIPWMAQRGPACNRNAWPSTANTSG